MIRVDLLVRTPHSKVDLPLVQLALYIARSMSQIKTDQGPNLVRFLGEWSDIE
jgi:hypothetical protein